MTHAPWLVTGAAGMLGSRLVEILRERGRRTIATDRDELDVTDAAGVRERVERERPAVIVNAAAWTDVDGAEDDEAAAAGLNAEAPGHLAAAARATGARLVHLSTDYVFGGDGAPSGNRAWRPDDPLAPVNAYGRTKAAGEAAVLAAGAEALVVRTSWLVDARGRNFLRTMLGLAASREAIDVVDDQVGRPTSAPHLARSIVELAERGLTGVHHVTNGGTCSWHGLASRIVAAAGLACTVRPCPTSRFPRPAPRPAWSVLDLEATEAVLGPMPRWEDAVDALVAEVNAPHRAAG